MESELPGDSVSDETPEVFGRGFLRLLTLVLVVAICGTGFFFFRRTALPTTYDPPAADQVREVAELTLDLSLLSQQLDELFRLFSQRVGGDVTLSTHDRLALESWLEFDQRFLERIQDRKTLKFERVTAHLRLGHGLNLLKMSDPSIAHFQESIKLMDELMNEYPLITSYQLGQSDAYYGLGRSLKNAGRMREAIAALDSAISLLKDPRFPPSEERQSRLVELYRQKREFLGSNLNAQ